MHRENGTFYFSYTKWVKMGGGTNHFKGGPFVSAAKREDQFLYPRTIPFWSIGGRFGGKGGGGPILM